MPVYLSLIVCTLGRDASLWRLLTSLGQQRYHEFEVIIVDQNDDSRIKPIVTAFVDRLAIQHLRSEKGLSRARNVGLRACRGDVIGFPDDDCWYDDGVTQQVATRFERYDITLLTGRTVDVTGMDSVSRHAAESGPISRSNVFVCGNSNTLFVRRWVATDVGGFDECLGVGAQTPFQSGEETDFILRCLQREHRAFYDRKLVVRHERNTEPPATATARAARYSQGYGRVLRTHRFGPSYLGTHIGRALMRGIVCLTVGDIAGARARYRWAAGSLRGYLAPVRDVSRGPNTIAR
jgi:glycosyltransferase involved in cell wall biosynthesis